MRNWLVVFVIGISAIAIAMGVHMWHAHRVLEMNRIKMGSCLKTIEQGMMLYSSQNAGLFPRHTPATQPATIPTTQPGLNRNMTYSYANMYPTCTAISPKYQQFVATFPSDFDSAATRPVDLWPVLADGHCVIVLRHCKTDDATKDASPINFADRSTQRNLSKAGITQAKQIAQSLSDRHIPIGKVYSSQFARCRESAELAFGKVEPIAALNSLGDSKEQLEEMRKLFRAIPADGNTVLVTHQSNLMSMTQIIPPMGEAVIVYPYPDGSFKVLGSLQVEKMP